MSDSLRPHESQHGRPPCPSPTPGVHSDSCPSSQWCHPAISSSVVPFSSCPQSLPASESFPLSQLFAWGDQSTGVSASAAFPPKKSQGWPQSSIELIKSTKSFTSLLQPTHVKYNWWEVSSEEKELPALLNKSEMSNKDDWCLKPVSQWDFKLHNYLVSTLTHSISKLYQNALWFNFGEISQVYIRVCSYVQNQVFWKLFNDTFL